jgi:hypothetical protein
MIYFIKAEITLDTRTNKVIIETGLQGTQSGKRIVFFPGKKIAEHWCDVLVNDRPIGPFSYAKDMCSFLCRELHGRKQHKKLANQTLGGQVEHG